MSQSIWNTQQVLHNNSPNQETTALKRDRENVNQFLNIA